MELHAMDGVIVSNHVALVLRVEIALLHPVRLIFETFETHLCGLANGFAQFRSATGLRKLGKEGIKLIQSIFEIHR